jgi:hypothetical protein
VISLLGAKEYFTLLISDGSFIALTNDELNKFWNPDFLIDELTKLPEKNLPYAKEN